MIKKDKIYLIISISSFFFFACDTKTSDNTKTENTTNTEVIVKKNRVIPPEFNADSSFVYVKTQADFGPRTPGSKAHEKCVLYLERFFKSQGAEVIIQSSSATTFDNKQWRLDNIIASLNPKAETRILLAAHYDSRPFCEKDPNPENKSKPCPGINDGASGVAVLMEVARNIKNKNPEIGVDIVLFDLEDYGDSGGDPKTWCLGSQYWSRNPHKPKYKAKYGILLDMVGGKNAVFPKEGHSVFFANDVVNKVWAAAKTSGYGIFFSDIQTNEITDDHYYINQIAQIPCIDIIHYIPATNPGQSDFFEHHHTTNDDINAIDKTTLKAVGQTLLEVIYNEK